MPILQELPAQRHREIMKAGKIRFKFTKISCSVPLESWVDERGSAPDKSLTVRVSIRGKGRDPV